MADGSSAALPVALAALQSAASALVAGRDPTVAGLAKVEAAVAQVIGSASAGGEADSFKARQSLAAMVEQSVMPHVAAAISRSAPTPGEPIGARARSGTFIDACRVLSALRSSGRVLVGRPIGGRVVDGVVDRLGHSVRFYQQHAIDRLEQDDTPDLRRIGADLLRVDVLAWGLGAVRTQAAMLARTAVRRAARVAEAFVRRRDIDNRFTLAETLRDVQDLVVLAQRATAYRDGVRAEAVAAGAAVFEDEDVVLGLLTTLGPLTDAVLRDMHARIQAEAMSPAAATGILRQVEAILTVCRDTPHGAAAMMLREVGTTCTRRLAECCDIVAERHAATSGGSADRERARALLAALDASILRLRDLIRPAAVK
jgi:hypothetical protein